MPHKSQEAMDTSTLLVVFLLVTAATLASYALSHWSTIRGALGFGWAATSIGTTMLLTAAMIVVLTFVFRGPLWRPEFGTGQQLRETAAASEETLSRRIAASPFSSTGVAAADQTSSKPTAANRRRTDSSPVLGGEEEPAPKSGSTQAMDSARAERSSQPVSQFRDAEPWAATQCIHNVTVGLSEPRWKIVNECDAPVAVSYSGGSIMLPAQAQRAVTFDEQTVPAGASYIACFIANPKAMTLIGAPIEERSTPMWREQFELARVNDSCLLRLQD